MGAYVYRIGAPSKVREAKFGDEQVLVGQVQYAYKPSYSSNWRDNNDKSYHQTVTLPTSVWKDRETPPFVVQVCGDRQEWINEAPVLRWPKGRRAVTDDPDWDGLQIGRLRVTKAADGSEQYEIEPLKAKV